MRECAQYLVKFYCDTICCKEHGYKKTSYQDTNMQKHSQPTTPNAHLIVFGHRYDKVRGAFYRHHLSLVLLQFVQALTRRKIPQPNLPVTRTTGAPTRRRLEKLNFEVIIVKNRVLIFFFVNFLQFILTTLIH